MIGSVSIESLQSWAHATRKAVADRYFAKTLNEFARAYLFGRIDMLMSITFDADFIIVGIRNEIAFLIGRATREGQ